ncbi:cyclic GMP-AMP synthase [Lates japonicus]|uniref:Cyclic GMP-AMP synthase n=1 Tax=Lates japonicus TaxID=270547 RepID=A0AAD3RIX2_LATJO|nr:cyclic GMP-AMP synthase [Lates japonicus]
MTGRGRSRKAKSPETKGAKSKTRPDEIKQLSLPICPRKDFTEEKQNGVTKEQKPKEREQKKPNHTIEKPSVQSAQKEKTTKHFTEDINKRQETPSDNTKAPVRGAKAKTRAGRAKSREQSGERVTKMKPELPKDMAKDSIEITKISHPDEFDVMLSIPVDRVDIKPFGDDGAFYSVTLKRGNSPLKKFEDNNILSASKMLTEFREEVKKCVKPFTEWRVTNKKKGCPAVTLTTEVQSVTISLDVVLCLRVRSSWPPFTNEGFKIEGWLGTKVKREYKRKPYYLVPKYEGRGTAERDGVLAKDIWRISFSHVEKDILKNHGSEKTCCEKEGERCCRKDCLKLLKHLLSLLKEKNCSFDKFYSYQAKTTLLHACCSRTKDSEWRASSLSQCFQQLLEDFVGHLEKGVLPNFFIPDQNLLSGSDQKKCKSLAHCIKNEVENGFPIFK